MLFRRCWVYTSSEMKIMTQGNDFNYSLQSVYEVISEEGTRAKPHSLRDSLHSRGVTALFNVKA